MLINTEGLVIKTIKYGDTSVITHIYTRAKGIKSFIVNGVRTKKATMPYGLFQPGTHLEISMYAHDQKKLLRLKEARIATPWKKIPFDIRRSSITIFICELLERLLKDSDEHEHLFDDLLEFLKWTDTTTDSLANLPVIFLIKLSGHLGFLPQGHFTDHSPYFDLQEGYFMSHPHSLHYMSLEHSRYFSEFLGAELHSLNSLSVSRQIRRAILDEMLKYYSLHIENFPAIKSLDVFQSIMEI